MSIVNHAPHLSDYEFSQIEYFLRELPQTIRRPTGLVSQIVNLLIRPQQNPETIYVIRGAHSTPLDPYGPYHFNIRIGENGLTHHVYINPVLYNVNNHGINISESGTVNFTCPVYWAYELSLIT